MRSINIVAFTCICLLLFAGCKKNVESGLDLTSTLGKANLKIIHASAYTVNYSAQLKVNTVRVSNVITNSTPYPGGGLNTQGSNVPWYMSLYPGPTFISLSVPKVGTSEDSLALTTKEVELAGNTYYSAYLTDTAANTQLVLVTENVTEPDNGTSRFKFVNLIPNQPFVDLYFNTVKVASNIPYKSVSADFILPYNTAGQWFIRPAGAAPSSAAIAQYPAGTVTQTIPNKRIFTVYSRGYTGGTGNRAPAVSLIYN